MSTPVVVFYRLLREFPSVIQLLGYAFQKS